MFYRRLLSCCLVLFIMFSLSSFAFAQEQSSLAFGTIWDHLAMSWSTQSEGVPVLSYIAGVFSSTVSDEVCSVSSDYLHHGNIYGDAKRTSDGDLKFRCVCDYCGDTFYVIKTDEQLNQAYDKYVSEDLPSPVKIIDSEGGLIWKPTVYDMRVFPDTSGVSASKFKGSDALVGIDALNHLIRVGWPVSFATPVVSDNSREFAVAHSVPSDNAQFVVIYNLAFITPVFGSYSLLDPLTYDFKLFSRDSVEISSCEWSPSFSDSSFAADDVLFFHRYNFLENRSNLIGVTGICHLPSFKITPAIPLDTGVGGSFGPDTRPSSVSGDFGYVGGDGEVSIAGDTYFFDESTTTYHNPVTGDTSNVTEWNYDYSDRSYNVVTDSGNTVTITYGDENVTVSESTVNDNGDTVTNNYTYYYITNNASGPDSPTVPHTHNYSDAVTQAATCIMSGVKTFTCSCGDSYTQNIPATGHNWTVRETVLTEYDDTGNLVQQGYTIFKCTVCGEENKSETSSVPPGGLGSGPGSDGGSGGLFSGIFSIIWDFFSFCWGFFNDFVVGGIRSFLDGLLHTTGTFLSFLNPFNWFS